MKIRNIFSLASVIKEIKKRSTDSKKNPEATLKELAKDWLSGYALYYGLWTVFIIGLLSLFAFSSFLGGPFVLAQIILFLLVGSVLILTAVLFWLWHKAKDKVDELKNLHERKKARDVNIHDPEVSEDPPSLEEGKES